MKNCFKFWKMDTFDKEFITELFLDSDSVSTLNRLVVAIANVVTENNDNIAAYTEAFTEEYTEIQRDTSKKVVVSVPRKVGSHYGDFDLFWNYSEEDFISRFKLKKTTIEALIKFLKEHAPVVDSHISLEKKVLTFLWVLTSDASYSEVGELFGLNKSSISHIFHEMTSLLADLRYELICWPSVEEQHVTRIKVNSRYKFPNCVGFIDTCRFNIGSKRKRKHNLDTVLLQAVCDESLMFIDIHVGDIGQKKKNKIFKESSIAKELRNFVDFENHILGDTEYKLKKTLITPFSSEELLTSEEMKFNEIHWKARSYIGRAFELLKERFTRLNHIDVCKSEFVNNLICSACVLHNFILSHEGCSEIKDEIIICDDGVTIDSDIVKTADEKRQFLCNYINYLEDIDSSFTPVLGL